MILPVGKMTLYGAYREYEYEGSGDSVRDKTSPGPNSVLGLTTDIRAEYPVGQLTVHVQSSRFK